MAEGYSVSRPGVAIEGSVLGTRQIPLTQGKVAIVDTQDYERVNQYNWYAIQTAPGYWYAATGMVIDGEQRTTYLHRFILSPPADKQVDHIDHDGLNCTRANMRLCTHQENLCNRKWDWSPTEDAFIQALRVLIEEHAIAGVAQVAKVSYPTIRRLLDGKGNAQRKTLRKLARAYPELGPLVQKELDSRRRRIRKQESPPQYKRRVTRRKIVPDTAVSRALAELIKEHSQAEIAKKSGVSEAAVSLLLHGKRGGRRRTIYKIIAAFPEFRRFLLAGNS